MDIQKQPATKGDIREAISGLETRLDAKIDERFGTLDAKVDERFGTLDAKIDANTKRLALEIVGLKGRVQEYKEQTAKTVSDNADRILTALDRYSRIVEADNRGVTLHGEILTNVQLKLQNHDQRLSRLEPPHARPGPGT